MVRILRSDHEIQGYILVSKTETVMINADGFHLLPLSE